MALFKEIRCVHCGKKTSMLNRTKLYDDEYVCGSCTSGMPAETVAALSEVFSDDFGDIRNFFDVVNKQREKLFRETKKFKCVHLDETNELFYLDHIRPKIYFSLSDLYDFALEYRPETVKEGFLSDKVTGNIHLTIQAEFPPFSREKIIARDVKSTGEIKGVFNKKLAFQNPKGMDEINMIFALASAQANSRRVQSLLRDNEE